MTKQNALSELLSAEGFGQMARDVITECDPKILAKYATIIVRNAPESMRQDVRSRLVALNLIYF